MLKGFNIISYIILFEQCILTLSFLFSGNKQLILVPSVAFRYHSNDIEPTTNAHPSDDWILYAQGWFFEENRFRAKLARTALSTVVSNINRKRVSHFTGSGLKYKTLCMDGLTYEMCIKTDGDGLVKKQFQLSNNNVQNFRVSGGTYGKVEYFLSTIDKTIQTKGEIFLCDDNGISIISDISIEA
ncbi:unnamed protein product [Rotaria sordida]|uniref:Uncharacterized protein n=1 Tax=Rotaria sordida TaxID=392033 RepID=A0A819NYG4_9BILA|nr:unnamed protein product [Rotaria sordida]